jgi:hypothetical protein
LRTRIDVLMLLRLGYSEITVSFCAFECSGVPPMLSLGAPSSILQVPICPPSTQCPRVGSSRASSELRLTCSSCQVTPIILPRRRILAPCGPSESRSLGEAHSWGCSTIRWQSGFVKLLQRLSSSWEISPADPRTDVAIPWLDHSATRPLDRSGVSTLRLSSVVLEATLREIRS